MVKTVKFMLHVYILPQPKTLISDQWESSVYFNILEKQKFIKEKILKLPLGI